MLRIEVKNRFQSEPLVYQRFLEILHDFSSKKQPLQAAVQSITSLFQSHPDLIEGFSSFLPDPFLSTTPSLSAPPSLSTPPSLSAPTSDLQLPAISSLRSRRGSSPNHWSTNAPTSQSPQALLTVRFQLKLPC
ncbi:MAG: hypothetical protein Q8P67_11665 [archaeon]|nr:hypothetical protein [archaeon]